MNWLEGFWYFNREVLVMGAITLFIGGAIWNLGEQAMSALIQKLRRRAKPDPEEGQ